MRQGEKVAVSAMGPFMVTLAGLDVPVNEPGPTPVQKENCEPGLALAWIVTTLPAFCHALAGRTCPLPEPAMVR